MVIRQGRRRQNAGGVPFGVRGDIFETRTKLVITFSTEDLDAA